MSVVVDGIAIGGGGGGMVEERVVCFDIDLVKNVIDPG